MKKLTIYLITMMMMIAILASCDDDDDMDVMTPKDPDTAIKVSVDRFSDAAGSLMRRSAVPSLPAANAPIDFDAGAPFITIGLGPDGEGVAYYNFDIMPVEPAPIYAFFKPGATTPTGLNIVDVIPGDEGYSDFWRVHKVNVPDDYVANTLTSVEEIQSAGYNIEATNDIVNCPIVPEGSTATKRVGGGSAALERGWYKEQLVYYFTFNEKTGGLSATGTGNVPVSPIYVSFNINPDSGNPASGPASGFMTEGSNNQTHNVVATLPADAAYSPLWSVVIYDNSSFGQVYDLSTAQAATAIGPGPIVNCPVVAVGPKVFTPKNPDTAPRASVDRFSDAAGTLMERSATPTLPAANTAINFDSGAPFLTKGLGPNGEVVEYYNFDVMPVDPAPIYAFFKPGATEPTGLNVVNVIPGDAGYNDFWRVHKVNVPESYAANSLTSLSDIQTSGYTVEETEILVNCPIVPEGSTASKRVGGGSAGLATGWYKGQIVSYFTFEEKEGGLAVTGTGSVPLSPIHVTFNVNPDMNNPASGPASGFVTESGSEQTHNVVATLPENGMYSPLWSVDIYDNANFDAVNDLTTAQSAAHITFGPTVNCPIVTIE